MKKILTLSAALMLCATVAMAQVNLYVTDCGAGSTTNNVANTCATNTGTAFAAFGSIVIPPVTRQGFVGSISVVDVQSSLAALPTWWDGRQTVDGGCRGAGFTLASDAGMGGTCPTLWDDVAAAGNNITCQPAVGGPNRVRFLLGIVLDAGSAYDLTGDGATELSVFKFSVLKSKSVGTGACTGCSAGACIVLNEVNLQTLSDTPDTFLRLTAPLQNNYITYNAGAPPCAGSTPTQNRTWGSVKALYR